jgi:dihydroorotase
MTRETKSKTSSVHEPRSSSLLVYGGRLVDPVARIDADMDLLLRDGRVAEVAGPGKIRGGSNDKFNARGLIVAPGFIDLHVHLREPGQAYKETIATGTAAAAAGGFTSICAMPNTLPVNDSPEVTGWMVQPGRAAVVNVFPIAAATQGSQGARLTDFRALQRAGAVAVTDDGKPILDQNVMQEALRVGAELQIPVIQHAEDTSETAGCSMHEGPTAFRLGLCGMPAAAEASIVERDAQLAQATSGRYHVAHISTAEALKAVRRAKRNRVAVTCEATPHHFTLIDEDIAEYNTAYKMNPPLRSAADREALLVALADGTVDAIATDHAPHATHEKQVEFERAAFGIIGLETALGLAITRLHLDRRVSRSRIVELFSSGPARVIGLKSRGSLQRGFHADVTIFDPKKRWMYQVAKTRSLARNTPFDGWRLTGKVVATVVAGKIVYRAD